MYGRKNISFVAVKTNVLTLEPWSMLELMIWGAEDDSFRHDIFLEGIEALDYLRCVILFTYLCHTPNS